MRALGAQRGRWHTGQVQRVLGTQIGVDALAPVRGGSQRVLVVVGRWWAVVCGVVKARRSFAVAVVGAPPVSPAVRVPKVFVVVRGGARSGDRSGWSPEGRRGDKSGRE